MTQIAETEKRQTLILNVAVPRQVLRDLLCTAVEGGSNYWASFSAADRTERLDYLRVKVTEHEKHDEQTIRVNRYVTADDLANGIEKLARADLSEFPAAMKHFCDALSDHDATTADVVLQMTVFGQVIYG